MAKKKDWVKVAIGAAILIWGTVTPIPDDIVTIPLGAGLMGSGLGYI